MPGCCFVQVKQVGVCLSWDGTLLDVSSKQIAEHLTSSTTWKVSEYRDFSGPYFRVFGLNIEIYGGIPKRSISRKLRLSEQQRLFDDDPLKKVHCYKVCNLKTQVISTTFKVLFTCEMIQSTTCANFPHGLIIIKCKIPALRLFSILWWKR